MFFYNTVKETIKTKYILLLIILVFNVLTIYTLSKYMHSDISKFHMGEREIAGRILSTRNLSIVFIPLMIIFSVYAMSNFFNIYIVHRVNNVVKLVTIYYLKLLLFALVSGSVIIFPVSFTSHLLSSNNEKINYMFCIPAQLFAVIFVCIVAAFLQLFLPNIVVTLIMICMGMLDSITLGGSLLINAFLLNSPKDIGMIMIRVGICFFLFVISVFLLSKKSYTSMQEEKEMN